MRAPLAFMLAALAGVVEGGSAASHAGAASAAAQAPRVLPHITSTNSGTGGTPLVTPSTRPVAYKILAYLMTVMRGQAFPPGSGPLPGLSGAEQGGGGGLGNGVEGGVGDIKAQLLGALLFWDAQVRFFCVGAYVISCCKAAGKLCCCCCRASVHRPTAAAAVAAVLCGCTSHLRGGLHVALVHRPHRVVALVEAN